MVQHLGPFDLEIAAGECLVLTGASGSGKSLLLRAVADLIPHEGEVWLGEQACSQTSPERWRREVGFLPAECQWWYDTIGEHFSQYEAALFKPLGFDKSVMQWEVSRCSTGERQRLALIRLLQQQPRALLLDEPTANVDARNTGQMEIMIKDYQRKHKIPMLWVSHQSEQVARIADRQMLMHNNQLETKTI
jgi:ABC-type iron transport system FetAB ATPase subunit